MGTGEAGGRGRTWGSQWVKSSVASLELHSDHKENPGPDKAAPGHWALSTGACLRHFAQSHAARVLCAVGHYHSSVSRR